MSSPLRSSSARPSAWTPRAGLVPLAASAFYDDFPAWAQTVLGSGISAGALVAVVLNLFFPHLGTRSTPRAAALSAASPGSGTQIP